MAPPTANEPAVERPTIGDLTGDNHYAQLARQHWLGNTKQSKVLPAIIEQEIWSPLEKDNFAFPSLLLLEQLQLLERYLWPGYSDDASNHHVLLLVLMVNVKRRESLPVWEIFSDRPVDFTSFFRRLLHMTIDPSIHTPIQTHLLSFVIQAFQSLDNGLVRKECAPLVSIGIWHNLRSQEARADRLDKNIQLSKAWRAAAKRYDGADESTQARIRFERSWLYTLVAAFFNKLYDNAPEAKPANLLYCERMLEFLSDLLSQLPTRRYVHALLHDLHILAVVKLSPLYADEENGLLRELLTLYQYYADFPIDDHSGRDLTQLEHQALHNAQLLRLQKVALRMYPEKLKLLVLANLASLDNRSDLEGHLASLSDEELKSICTAIGLRTAYDDTSLVTQDRAFFLEAIVSVCERRPSYKTSLQDLSILPTEETLYDRSLSYAEDYNSSRPLPTPKLNLQYLTMGDFLWRSFMLYRSEALYAIRKDLEAVVKRVSARLSGTSIRFTGFSRQALPISKPAIIDVLPPRVGEDYPARVEIEIALDLGGLAHGVAGEWQFLRPGDIVYLVQVQPLPDSTITNGHHNADVEIRTIRRLRCAQVVDVLDDQGHTMREHGESKGSLSTHCRMILNLDQIAYQQDKMAQENGKDDLYSGINLLIKRRARENNFKAVLESIKHLALSDVPAPAWFQDVFLGYSDPAAATFERLPNRLRSVDYRDTFIDWAHLNDSLPGKVIVSDPAAKQTLSPPYVLEDIDAAQTEERPTKKRRRELTSTVDTSTLPHVKVSTYRPANKGPYPSDAPKVNQVRFTPAQIQAITSGTQPGLSIIVGPPGTGKTDVTVQVVNNIYHAFPEQRTLLVAHSNQALNQLFQKIMALDIDERHLLRLGHGEEELESDSNYSKHGRVESLLQNAQRHLYEVSRLAASIDAPGAHGSSCETAEYFNQVYIEPAWTKFWTTVQSNSGTAQDVAEAFPFHAYFENAPQPLFPPEASRDEVIDIASGCHHHMEHIFDTLSHTRPFEILRSGKDKSDYLLIKEARIIAMTSTHAAMQRQRIADLGFRYDNVIMEEAAQITEIETFIPLALQKPRDGKMKVQRVVLVGDHLQNSPVVQNLAFRQYANLEQSLFLRLVRLGVPTIMLDQQGRARPSLADLYRWRYPRLSNLDRVQSAPEFQQANAGFRYDYQFINVEDYKGRGEMEPSAHFVQNLGEAEYAVAIYQYMRLLGYPAEQISILTTYAGQRNLIRDVLGHRCLGNSGRLFGLPAKVMTVDKYQGEQNDYVILSLVRTSRPGYLRDLRRLTVALSRARLGLYIVGRQALFESCFELRPVFEKLFARPTKLALVTGEMFPTTRAIEATDKELEGKVCEMEGVEHLGQYVYEMTQAKIAAVKAGNGVLPPVADTAGDDSAEEVV